MRFYHIENKYIDFLRQFDPRVLYNKNEQRPYIGIIFEIEDIRYYALLSSPKPKHIHMKNNLDFRKIDSGKLGAVNLNNMIPVPDSVLIPIHIGEITDPKYRRLLNEQYRWLLHDMINIENIFNVNGIFKFCLCPDRGQPFDKNAFFLFHAPDHNICISNVYCQYHFKNPAFL